MTSLINDGQPFASIDAPRMGYSRKTLGQDLDQHLLRREFRGVYVDNRVTDCRESRLRSIRLITPPGAVVCNESAAWLYEVDTYKPSEQHLLIPSLVVPHSTTRVTTPGVQCRQAILDGRDVIDIDGLMVTTPVRTASDLLRRLYRPYAIAAADGMARAGLVTTEDVIEFVHGLKGYPGIRQARSLAHLIEPLSGSPGESWQRLRIIDAGFPRPKPQHHIVDAFGHEYFLDLAYPELLIASEYDGREFHTDEIHKSHDRGRRAYLGDVFGWRFVNAERPRIFGVDITFETELGQLLGRDPLPRFWGT